MHDAFRDAAALRERVVLLERELAALNACVRSDRTDEAFVRRCVEERDDSVRELQRVRRDLDAARKATYARLHRTVPTQETLALLLLLTFAGGVLLGYVMHR